MKIPNCIIFHKHSIESKMYSEKYYRRKYPMIFSKFDFQKPIYSREVSPFYFIFENVVIKSYEHTNVIYFNSGQRETAETLVDLIAYFFYMPSFIDTGNKKLNYKLTYLYDSLDLFYLSVVNNLKKRDEIILIGTINHPILLAFYNTALKQPEPLAKCVFLFRIIEYYHNTIANKGKLVDCIEPLYLQALKHKFIPLDLIPHYSKIKKYYPNLIVNWKKKSKQIYNNWSKSGILLGVEIYKRARCGIAHGRHTHGTSSCSIILHDYSKDYKFISEVNIFLELICRYIIESQNPHFIKYFKLNYRNTEFGHYEKKPRITKIVKSKAL
jgi:hypothetical protein